MQEKVVSKQKRSITATSQNVSTVKTEKLEPVAVASSVKRFFVFSRKTVKEKKGTASVRTSKFQHVI